MIFSLLQRYSLKLIFALSLLLGLQIPSFIAHYETRLDAHYLESKDNLKQYQLLADLLYEGDLTRLIEQHKRSEVALFKAETDIIETLVLRTQFLENQKESLKGSLIKRLTFLSSQMNQQLFIETKNSYQANIVLNKEAIVVGLAFSVLTTLLVELLFILLIFIIKQSAKQLTTRADKIN